MWLAPNLITLIGIAGLVAAYLITLYYLPGLAGMYMSPLTVTRCKKNSHSGPCRGCANLGLLLEWVLGVLVPPFGLPGWKTG